MEMTESEIVSILKQKIDRGLNEAGGEISENRLENYDRYIGRGYGTERDGYSSVVTREAMETVEWALPSIMRVFTTSSSVVRYAPVGPEDEGEAQQQTDVANYYLTKENNSFLSLYNWFKDALMYPNGYIKLYMDERVTTKVQEFRGLNSIMLNQKIETLELEGEVEILEQNYETKVILDPNGMKIIEEQYDCRVRITKTEMVPKLVNIPPDELLVADDLLTIDLDEADFICHRAHKTYSELVEEGYDQALLDSVPYGDDDFSAEDENKRFSAEMDFEGDDTEDKSMRHYWVNECYVKIDTDGDGIAENRKIVIIGNEIFEDEEINYQPFVALSAILMPHQHPGLSLVDTVKDIQEVKSTLLRQLLDNVYKANIRRKYIGDAFISDEGGTLDVLLDNASEFIPARDPNALREEQIQPIVADILPVFQTMSDVQSVRTGVSPQLSLDPNILKDSTMGAFRAALDNASQRIEMIVRIFAETGMKTLFVKMHELLRTYVDVPRTLRLRGEWVNFNPAYWQERNNVSVHVGLGHNNKDEEMMLLQQLLGLQQQSLQFGLTNPQNLYNTMDRLVELADLGDTREFFVDPTTLPPPMPQQPGMMEQLAMADMQMRQTESQANIQMKAQELQIKAQDSAIKMQEDQAEMQMKIAELEAKLEEMSAGTKLKEAQTYKTLEEARAQDIENDGVETGVVDLLTEQLRG